MLIKKGSIVAKIGFSVVYLQQNAVKNKHRLDIHRFS
jgi:hypothetical protein